MIFEVWPNGTMKIGQSTVPVALGRSGVRPAAEKREGDGATPAGLWPIRFLLYRPDRGDRPKTFLSAAPISPNDGWCDAADDPAYNRPVALPYPASAEGMWRDDDLYDRVVVLAHNDDPVVAGMGSAIFVHIRRQDGGPTEGCVALFPADMAQLLATARPGDAVRIHAV
jgi:L,D-peptidoglycan transpeptidase YkuD (ErfK/YbiS/YcfS/YnhG family)